jgi:antitoxin VapB
MYIPVAMTSVKTKVFKSNKTQAVRLPKAVAFDDDVSDVEIVARGNTRIITPAGDSWGEWFDGPAISDDFMIDREQPRQQERESL